MCGIGGHAGLGPDCRLDPGVLDALSHRGPDSAGTVRCSLEHSSWELAFRRLSIVDLSAAGDQPMANEDGSLVMVFNGEIYNWQELRRLCIARGHRFRSSMDGEVVLHLWEMEGPDALARLNGIFAVAVASTLTGEIVIARDPLGVKPLVYATDRDRLWFASEIQALAAAGAPLGGNDPIALAQFLSFLWIPDPRTPHANVRTVLPGHALRWYRGSIEQFRYCVPLVPEPDARPIDIRSAQSACVDHLHAAVRRQVAADVPVALMASGGVDSGLIWSRGQDVIGHAFTIEWEGDTGSERLHDDARAVSSLERRFATPVVRVPGQVEAEGLPLSGDLFADPAHGLARAISRAARDSGYKVLLSGQGGDELFAGYRRHRVAPLLERLRLGAVGTWISSHLRSRGRVHHEYIVRLLRAAAEPTPIEAYLRLCTYSSPRERAQALGCTESEVSDQVVWQRHLEAFAALPRGLSFLRAVMALDLAVYLPGLGLSYTDRAGMEFGVEIRVPWLDLELVRWSLTLPDDFLIRRGRTKWITRSLALNELSPGLADRPKRGLAAPALLVKRPGVAGGEHGFRQGDYFARARAMLEEFTATRADRPGLLAAPFR